MTADEACQALQRPAPLLGRQHRPRMLRPAAGRLKSARGGAVTALWERMRTLLDRRIPDACGAIPPKPKALESRLWAKEGRIDKAGIRWLLDSHSLEWQLGAGVPTSEGEQGLSVGRLTGAVRRQQRRHAIAQRRRGVLRQLAGGRQGRARSKTRLSCWSWASASGCLPRYFLDSLRELCRRHKKDYYDRLTYIAADRSERMLHDVLRHGVLSEHPGRYRVRQVDAMEPEMSAWGTVPACRWRHAGSVPSRCGRCF